MAKKQFKAESKRLLDLMINSIYTHKEIFLREIISNSSDAIDKLAYLALTDQNVGMSRSDFAITIAADESARTLTVSDNGIGMDKEEMENNLGTICKSGSLQFKQETEKNDGDDIDIIGQFGVGFYSAFMVSEKVTVISKKYGSNEAWQWQSAGADGYTVTPCEKGTVGTEVIMQLKEDTEDEKYSDFLKTYMLRSLVKKYSDYIRYPIKTEVEESRVTEETKDSDKPEYETIKEVKTLNSMVPIWRKNKKEVDDAEYYSFYKDKFNDYEEPIAVIHTSVEGVVTYKSLMFIPSRAPFNFYSREFKKGLQLYSSGVAIMENCEELLPDCFAFVRGIVDSEDLSLNISREMLQHNRQLKVMETNLEKKIKTELEKLLETDREKYEKFYSVFGLQLKYGIVNDYGIKKDLLKDLILFWSNKNGKPVSLKEYVEAMPEEQKYIYYASGENNAALSRLPQLEQLSAKGYDVLFMTDEVDEFVTQSLSAYGEKEFRSISNDDLGLTTDEEKKAIEEKTESAKAMLDFVKETLGDSIKQVRLSAELGSHPVCVVPDEGMTFEMEKYLKKVNFDMGMKAEKIFEINPDHAVFELLCSSVEADGEKAAKIVKILYSQALLMANLPLENPSEYTELVCELLK